MYFAVCSLARLSEVASSVQPSHLLTVMSSNTDVIRPETVLADNHRQLFFNDITQHSDGLVMPAETHVGEMLAFFNSWDRQAPMVIHCWAGVSRSTASAFIGRCFLMPEVDEMAHAQLLRQVSPSATPNAKLVELADTLLGRDGHMVEAITSIGRGEDCFEGNPFRYSLDDSN